MKDMKPSDVEGLCPPSQLVIIADHVLDVSFDWSVRYSAMSPAKLSLAQSKIMSTGVWGKMSDDSYSARNRDEEDLISEPLSG